MENKMNMAAYMVEVGKMELREIPMPVCGDDDVVINVKYVGVCGSDVHFFETGVRKGRKFDLPFILGHECSGIVTEVGKNVRTHKIGDRICFEPQITCGKCRLCKSGRYNLCPDVRFPSVPPYDGMFRSYVNIPAHLCFKLPENVTLEEGALIEPLAVGLSAAEKGEVSLGQSVVILGSGCIGMMILMACKARGAGKVIVVDLYDKRLDKALELGASAVINASRENVQQRLTELLDGEEGADVVFEAASNPHTAAQTSDLIRRGGIIVLVGNINETTPYRFMDLMYKEGEIRPIYRYRNNFQTALTAVSEGRINIASIISHKFAFNDIQEAFEKSTTDKMNMIKAVIKLD